MFCGMMGYHPEVDQYWDIPWTMSGWCNPGVWAPAPVPVPFPVLTTVHIPRSGLHLGGCPGTWHVGILTTYDARDCVSKDNKVFCCKGYPYSGNCSQQGYEPETNPATPGAWTDAWVSYL